MGEIIDLDVDPPGDLPVETVLGRASRKGLTDAIVIGWDANGDLYYNATYADGPEALWLMEMAKRHLLTVGSGEE